MSTTPASAFTDAQSRSATESMFTPHVVAPSSSDNEADADRELEDSPPLFPRKAGEAGASVSCWTVQNWRRQRLPVLGGGTLRLSVQPRAGPGTLYCIGCMAWDRRRKAQPNAEHGGSGESCDGGACPQVCGGGLRKASHLVCCASVCHTCARQLLGPHYGRTGALTTCVGSSSSSALMPCQLPQRASTSMGLRPASAAVCGEGLLIGML